MTTSAHRTLVVGGANIVPLSAREVMLGYPRLWWPEADPCEFLDYTLDVTAPLEGDTITAASLSVCPSNSGDLIPAFLNVSGNLISFWGYGGIAGRDYRVRIKTQTTGLRNPNWTIGLPINPLLASYVSTLTPITLGSSPDLTWSEGQFMLGPIFNLPATTVVSTGTNQLTAAPMKLSKCLVIGVGNGVVLPQAATFCGAEMPVYNRTGGTLTVYPYSGDQIESLGVNIGAVLQNEQTATFSVSITGQLILS